jgi:hypothetical protein
MAITDRDLADIEMLLAGSAAPAALAAEFRRLFPGLTLTRCAASDMDHETPYRRYPGFDLHLVDRSDHCWRMTADPGRATGIVLAARKPQPVHPCTAALASIPSAKPGR